MVVRGEGCVWGCLLLRLLLGLSHVRHHLILVVGLHLSHVVDGWRCCLVGGLIVDAAVVLGIHLLLLLVRHWLPVGPGHYGAAHLLLLLSSERLRSHAYRINVRLLPSVELLIWWTLVTHSIAHGLLPLHLLLHHHGCNHVLVITLIQAGQIRCCMLLIWLLLLRLSLK